MDDPGNSTGEGRYNGRSRTLSGRLLALLDRLFGYDYFISYAHYDGTNYPRRLCDRLEASGFRVFLDTDVYVAGEELRAGTRRRVRMSSYLVVVARPHALRSKWVLRELQVYLGAGRVPIVVNVNGALVDGEASPEILHLLEDRLYVPEAIENNDGEPSDRVLEELRRSFASRRQETKRLRFLSGAAVAFALLAAIAVALALGENRARREAVQQSKIAFARQLAAQSQAAGLQPDQLERSVLLALASWDRWRSSEALLSLRQSLNLLPRPLYRLRHPKGVKAVAFSTDGSLIASADPDHVRVWRGSDGVELGCIEQARVVKVAFNEDGTRLTTATMTGLSGSHDVVTLWDWRAGKILNTVPFKVAPTCVEVSRWGRFVAAGEGPSWYFCFVDTAGRDGCLRLSVRKSANALAFSEDERLLAVAASEGAVSVWDTDRRRTLPHPSGLQHPGAVALSPRGDWVVVAGKGAWDDGQVKWWPVRDDGRSKPDQLERSIVVDVASGTVLAFNPGGDALAIGGGQTVRVVRVADAQEEFSTHVKEEVRALAFSPGGHCLAAACLNPRGMNWALAGIVRVWDLQKRDEVARVVHEGQVTAISFEEKDGLLATASEDGTARVWDCSAALYTTREEAPSAVRVGRFDGRPAQYDRHASAPVDRPALPAWPPKNSWTRLASRGEWRIEWNYGQLRVVNEHGGEPALSLSDAADLVAFDPVRNHLATVGWQKSADTIRLLEVTTGKELARFQHGGKVLALALSPDDRFLASGSKDGTARIWDLKTRSDAPVATCNHPVATSPSLAARSADGPQPGDVHLLCFTPNGRYLATGCADNMVRVWEVATGRLVHQFAHPTRSGS